MIIAVVGTGYVGLVTGACFAELGVTVACIDVDRAKIDGLKRGVMPIYEPGLESLVGKNVRERRLSFTTDLSEGVAAADVVFIAVGTPPRPDGEADLGYVREVAAAIGRNLTGYKVIVTKSTVPMGTGTEIRRIVEANLRGPVEFGVASNPEFLREGSAVEDFMRPNRIVIGAETSRAAAVLKDLYRPLYLNETPFIVTGVVTAEMIKYACNAFLATKISFINEIANLCDQLGADVHDVARGMGLDNRIGKKFLHPGPGFGGSCFPKDTQAIVSLARKAGCDMKIAAAVIEVNDRQTQVMLGKIADVVPDPKGKIAAVLGLSFKPNTDDIRESPAIKVLEGLQRMGFSVRAYDPIAMDNARAVLTGVTLCEDEYATARGADLLVLATEWNQFRALDLGRVRSLMRAPVLVDMRNVYEPDEMVRLGFTYRGVGRQAAASA